MNLDNLIRIERTNYLVAALYVLISAVVAHQEWTLGVLVGAGLSCANFTVMRLLAQKWTQNNPKRRLASQAIMIPKMGIIILAIYLASRFLPISVIGLGTGFAIFLISIAIETLRVAINPPQADVPEEEHG